MTYKHLVFLLHQSLLLLRLYLASDDCIMKSARSTRDQTRRNYNDRYSNRHQIEVGDK